MNFFAFEYEKNINFKTVDFEDTEYLKLICETNYLFIQKKIYSDNYHDDWSDENRKETKVGITTGFEQLKEQIFILIKQKEKIIYSNIDSVKKIRKIIRESVNVDIEIFQRLVSIEDFEDKISQLISISIKPHSIQQRILFAKDVLNFETDIIPDLSQAENFKLDIVYNISSKSKSIAKMYKKMVEQYNVGEVIFKGSDKENLFQFNQQSLIHKIPICLSKTGDGNTYEFKEVFRLLMEIV